MADMQTIAIKVTPEAAKAFQSATVAGRRKLELLLSLRLLEVDRSRQSLEEIMREISRSAQKRGLTEKILEDVLREN